MDDKMSDKPKPHVPAKELKRFKHFPPRIFSDVGLVTGLVITPVEGVGKPPVSFVNEKIERILKENFDETKDAFPKFLADYIITDEGHFNLRETLYYDLEVISPGYELEPGTYKRRLDSLSIIDTWSYSFNNSPEISQVDKQFRPFLLAHSQTRFSATDLISGKNYKYKDSAKGSEPLAYILMEEWKEGKLREFLEQDFGFQILEQKSVNTPSEPVYVPVVSARFDTSIDYMFSESLRPKKSGERFKSKIYRKKPRFLGLGATYEPCKVIQSVNVTGQIFVEMMTGDLFDFQITSSELGEQRLQYQ